MRAIEADYLRALDPLWERLYAGANARLIERIARHEAPEANDFPAQDICLVYRIPNPYKSTSGLVLPDEFAQRHDSLLNHGLLISAGPEAMDVLTSHGILLGDYVKFARFAGEEEEAGRAAAAIEDAKKSGATKDEAFAAAQDARASERQRKKLLELQVPYIHGSMDLLERLQGPMRSMEMVRVRLPGGKVEHQIIPV